jgi:hypothetical protein
MKLLINKVNYEIITTNIISINDEKKISMKKENI